jgi:hypothetical protein
MLPAKEIFSDEFRLVEIRKKKKKKKRETKREREKEREREKKKSLPVFIGITIDGSPKSLLRVFWEKKKIKSV